MSISSVVFLRTNINWSQLDLKSFESLNQSNATSRPLRVAEARCLPAAVKSWNDVFKLSFFLYRQRLREIAELNWSRIVGLDLFIKSATLEGVLRTLDDFIVLPVDDDDWYHPNVVNVLLGRDLANIDALFWSDAVYGLNVRRGRTDVEQLALRPRARFRTNDYAITHYGYAQLDSKTARKVLLHHVAAGKVFSQQGKTSLRIDEYLSVTSKSLASIRNLLFIRSNRELIDQLTAHLAAPCAIPHSLEWATPYIELTRQLNEDLFRSVRAARVS